MAYLWRREVAARARAEVLVPPLGRVALNSRAPVIAPTCAWVSFVGSSEKQAGCYKRKRFERL